MSDDEAWDAIAKIARDHAFVLEAAGGVMTLVHPDTQRAEGLYAHIQYVHGLGPHPDSGGAGAEVFSNIVHQPPNDGLRIPGGA